MKTFKYEIDVSQEEGSKKVDTLIGETNVKISTFIRSISEVWGERNIKRAVFTLLEDKDNLPSILES